MKKAVYDALIEALEENGAEYSEYPEYSGRGMYGKTTHGIVVDGYATLLSAVAIAGARLTDAEESFDEDADDKNEILTVEDLAIELGGIRSDSMGGRTIFY